MVSIDGYEDVPENDEGALAKAVTKQPVSVAICASEAMQFYSSGVMAGAGSCTGLNHGVLAVGYDEARTAITHAWRKQVTCSRVVLKGCLQCCLFAELLSTSFVAISVRCTDRLYPDVRLTCRDEDWSYVSRGRAVFAHLSASACCCRPAQACPYSSVLVSLQE